MYKVETHNNSKNYFKNLKIEENAIYITSNTSIANMIKELTNVDIQEYWRILDIENFSNIIYPNWNNTINKARLKAQLRLILFDLKENINDNGELRELKYLEDNIDILFSDFVFLINAGVKSLESIPKDIKEKLSFEIFNRFTKNKLFNELSDEVLKYESFSNIELIMQKQYMKKNNKDNHIKLNKRNIEKIYFFNINYIDLNRYMIITMLNIVGYELIFRIPYFKNLNVVNKNWTMIYKDFSIFDLEINKEYSLPIKSNIKYIEYLEGNYINDYQQEKVKVKNYREISDFIKDTKKDIIITFYKDSLGSCIKRSELNIENHCYQSRIGSFIFNLFRCKKKDTTVKMDFNTYMEMITSGWISYKNWNGIRLSAFLVENEEYFSGVSTIDEIIERIEKIKDIDEIGNIFEEQNKIRIKKDNKKAFLSNPFRSFGYVNLEKYKITANYMLMVTMRLKAFILKIFEKSDEILDVKQTLEYMTYLFRNEYIVNIYNNGNGKNKKIVRKIYGVLENPNLFGEKIHKDDFGELFNIYLFLNDNEEKHERDFSIDQLEGVILRDKLLKNVKKLCVADLSYKAFEKYLEKYKIENKIFSMEEIKVLLRENLYGISRRFALYGVELQEKSKESFEHYIKFAIANLLINYNGNVEFSWIEGLRKEDNKSILLKQIESIYRNIEYVKQYLDFNDYIKDDEMIEELEYSYDKKEIKNNLKSLPEVDFRNLDFCGNKFLYSSIIEDYPIYYSDFHHRMLFSVLISMLKNNIEKGYSNLYNFFLPLFPQWEDVLKKNILDCEYSRKILGEYKYFEGLNYPKSIDKLYLLKSKYIVTEKSRIRNRYNKGEFNSNRYFNEFVDEYLDDDLVNSGLHCKMCPYCYICKKGDFAIDNK